MRSRFVIFILVFQSLLVLMHWFVYETWVTFGAAGQRPRRFSFCDWHYGSCFRSVSSQPPCWRGELFYWAVRIFYTAAAVWLGTGSFCFLASCACWLAVGVAAIFHLHVVWASVANVLFGIALLASVYAIINAALTRITRVTVKLPNLPESWRGRVAALVSDTHLGHIRNFGFLRRVVRTLNNLEPDVVFISGDMYDGTTGPLRVGWQNPGNSSPFPSGHSSLRATTRNLRRAPDISRPWPAPVCAC